MHSWHPAIFRNMNRHWQGQCPISFHGTLFCVFAILLADNELRLYRLIEIIACPGWALIRLRFRRIIGEESCIVIDREGNCNTFLGYRGG